MFSSFIEEAILSSGASQLTEIFLYVLVFLFSISLVLKWKDKHGAFTNYTPTLLTSLGILGTFIGIVAGLLEFDTLNIEESIGPLLEGLKTAFMTSLVGMFFSILYKGMAVSGVLTKKKNAANLSEDEITSKDIYEVMMQQANGIDLLKKAISENDESSLVGQVKLLRSDISDNNKTLNRHLDQIDKSSTSLLELVGKQHENFKEFEDRLWIKLQDFADMLSKSATEQVIEALRQVIQDFNNNLIEQFGDNFKELNVAVMRLLEWQENYKDQLADMGDKYALGVESITQTEASVSHISEEAKNIPVAMTELKGVLEVNQHQIDELGRHLEAFGNVRDRAVEAVPEIREQIDRAIDGAIAANDVLAKGMKDNADHMSEVLIESSEQFKDSVKQANNALVESAQATANSSESIKDIFSTAIEDINNNFRDMISQIVKGSEELSTSYRDASQTLIDGTRDTSQTFASNIEEMRSTLERTITEHATEHRRQADRVFAGLEQSISNALSNTAESVEKQVEMIDKTTGQEIEKVMNSMGSALTSISGKFTKDYKILVDQMNEVVNNRGQ